MMFCGKIQNRCHCRVNKPLNRFILTFSEVHPFLPFPIWEGDGFLKNISADIFFGAFKHETNPYVLGLSYSLALLGPG